MELVKLNEEQTVHEFACLKCHLSITVENDSPPLTVNDLVKQLTQLQEQGMGNRFVLVPNTGNTYSADYIFLDGIDTNDSTGTVVYLTIPTPEADNEWGEKYGL